MKTVCFARHAKSSWADLSQKDIDRPLNPRGLRDAPLMAEKLKDLQGSLDGLLVSPARRTQMTSKYFAEAYNLPADRVLTDDDLYLPSVTDVYKALGSLSDAWSSVAIFGHNPCWTDIALFYSNSEIMNVPTCGIYIVDFKLDSWVELSSHTGRLRQFIYPKMYTS